MDRTQPSALIRLRELIFRGDLRPGERVLEVDLATRLQLSRTPIRQALPALALEGLLVRVGGRGYAVRAFTRDDTLRAVQLRALLEGAAARRVVLAGGGAALADALKPLLEQGDDLLRSGIHSSQLEEEYGSINAQFHATVIEAAEDGLLTQLIARCNLVPFTAPGAVAFGRPAREEVVTLLRYAHRQHHIIVEALSDSDGLRVEMMFREHATTQEDSMAIGRHHTHLARRGT